MTQSSKQETETGRPVICCRPLAELLDPGLFRALCDPSRLGVLARVAAQREPTTVGDIAAGLPLSLSVVSRHLAMLRDAGLLEATRRGREVLYRFRHEALAQTLRELADAVESCCPGPTKSGGRRRKA